MITLWSSPNLPIFLNNKLSVKEKTTRVHMAAHISSFQAAWRAFIASVSSNTLKLALRSNVL